MLWLPRDAVGRVPLIVSLHGTSSWAFDELALWHGEALNAGYGILALQWWFGGGGANTDYYTPTDLHRELRTVLSARGYSEGSALLHGFSRGSSNVYALTALDRQSKDRYYAMTLANSGGATTDYPPNVQITNGAYGYNVFSGTYWAYFCGGQDPSPDRDEWPAMRRTAEWVTRYGGVPAVVIEDANAGHGGFHMSAANVRGVLKAFGENLALRTN